MRVIPRVLTGVWLSLACSLPAAWGQSQPARETTEELVPPAYALLERLIDLPRHVDVLQASSHNKTGHNGDENWPLYTDEQGDGVIFDAAGPGCIRSMWGTHFADDAVLKFTFDDETEPRFQVNEIEFYKGKLPEFPPPLVSYEHRGHYAGGYTGNCFVPIPFEKRLKISIAGESRFFHVIYERYPYGTPVESFTGNEDRQSVMDAFARMAGTVVAEPPDAETVGTTTDWNQAGAEVVLFERKDAAGVIRKIVIEADGSDECLQNSQLTMCWDGHVSPDVVAPLGMFFACANHAGDLASLPLRVEKLDGGRVRLTCRFPMPFWKSARIAWRNRSQYGLGPIQANVTVAPNAYDRERSAYFKTLYRHGTTSIGRDWLLYETPGTGWFVGAVQTMQHGHYCEGDEHFSIDGAVSPQINGTGSEDYYLACFWPNFPYNSPFACGVGDIQVEGGGHIFGAYRIPSSYARFHLEAPIPFYCAIDARIQHGGLNNLQSSYASLAYCYVRSRPALRQTDFLDVGNAASEESHGYTATESTATGFITANPEGAYFDSELTEDGRTHTGGTIRFTVAIDPGNDGVRLRRLLDQGSPRQSADVYVDGAFAGTWYHGYHNEHLRWFESDLDIHPNHTRGKSKLDVELRADTTEDRGAFTDFNYRVYCFEAPAPGGADE